MAEDFLHDRLEKVERLRASGVDPYSRGFKPTHGSVAAKALIGDAERTSPVSVAGRLMVKRQQGGLVFADLQDGQGRIQLMANKGILGDEEFARFAELDLGDIIGVTGPIFRTKRGEVTVEVHSFQLLTKSLRPMPEKWHGLKDVEIRYRQRYVDLIANPEVREVFRARTKIITSIRGLLDERGFIEVDRVSRTSVPGVYAAGDCTGVLMLASVAAMQGRVAMWHALGESVHPIRLGHVAATIFTDPEIATVGVSQRAVDAGEVAARTQKLPLATNPRAKMAGFREGFVKLFTSPGTGVILGGVIVAPRASELILAVSVAVEQRLTAEQLTNTFAVYPSLSGSITEAARKLMEFPPDTP